METIKLDDREAVPAKNFRRYPNYLKASSQLPESHFCVNKDNKKIHDTVIGDQFAHNRGNKFVCPMVDNDSAPDKDDNEYSKRIIYPNYLKASSKLFEKRFGMTKNSDRNDDAIKDYPEKTLKIQASERCEGKKDISKNLCAYPIEQSYLRKNSSHLSEKHSYSEKTTEMSKTKNIATKSLSQRHFCLNKNNKRNHETVIGDQVVHNKDSKFLCPMADNDSILDKDGNEYPKRIIYPNYLKASSKLFEKRFGKSRNSDKNGDAIKDYPGKTREMQTSERCEGKNNISKNVCAYPVEYPSSHLDEKHPNSEKTTEISKTNSSSKKADCEMSKNDHIRDIRVINMGVETLKRENEDLKCKLKSIEASLQEALDKCNEAQKEIKHLKIENERQRKTIKCQKNHLKIQMIKLRNNFKRNYYFNMNEKNSEEKKTCEISDGTPYEDGNNGTNTSTKNFDLEITKEIIPKQRILELEEQNRLMKQGLIELRNFLKTNSDIQSVDMQDLNFSSYDSFQNGNASNQNFLESFDSPPGLNSKTFTTEKSGTRLREHSEKRQKLTKLNEGLNEKRRDIKNWERTNYGNESLGDDRTHSKFDLKSNNHPTIQPTENSLTESPFDIHNDKYVDCSTTEIDPEAFKNYSTLKKNNMHSKHFPHTTTKVKRKIKKNHAVDSGYNNKFS